MRVHDPWSTTDRILIIVTYIATLDSPDNDALQHTWRIKAGWFRYTVFIQANRKIVQLLIYLDVP